MSNRNEILCKILYLIDRFCLKATLKKNSPRLYHKCMNSPKEQQAAIQKWAVSFLSASSWVPAAACRPVLSCVFSAALQWLPCVRKSPSRCLPGGSSTGLTSWCHYSSSRDVQGQLNSLASQDDPSGIAQQLHSGEPRSPRAQAGVWEGLLSPVLESEVAWALGDRLEIAHLPNISWPVTSTRSPVIFWTVVFALLVTLRAVVLFCFGLFVLQLLLVRKHSFRCLRWPGLPSVPWAADAELWFMQPSSLPSMGVISSKQISWIHR